MGLYRDNGEMETTTMGYMGAILGSYKDKGRKTETTIMGFRV